MARKLRFSKLNSRYHVMLRGVSAQNIFADDTDRVRLCLFLQAATEKHGFLIHAFCFMQNHLHFILEPKQSPLYECVHAFAFRYAQYFNKRHRRQGYLFQGRFRSILIEDGLYLKRLIRYIHLNPLEACLVDYPEDFQWSSHRSYLGITDYVWLTTSLILSRFAPTRKEAVHNFIEFIKLRSEISLDTKEIMQAMSSGLYGSDSFLKEMTSLCEKKIDQSLLLSPSLSKKHIPLEEAVIHICNQFQVDFKDLASSNKQTNLVDARSALALLGRIGQQNWNLQDVATLLNKNHGSISRLASKAKLRPTINNYVQELISE